MFYVLKNGFLKPVEASSSVDGDEHHVGVIDMAEVFATGDTLGLEQYSGSFGNVIPRFESQDGYDFLCATPFPEFSDLSAGMPVYIYLRENLLLFISDNPSFSEEVLSDILSNNPSDLTLGSLLCAFLDRLVGMEAQSLEDSFLGENDAKQEKKLYLALLYCRQCCTLVSSLMKNQNHIVDKKAMKNLTILLDKLLRMRLYFEESDKYFMRLKLSEQVHIAKDRNNILKKIGVFLAVSLPILAISGWYGMNLIIPEYDFNFSYPVIAAVTLAAVASGLFILKKKKWF